MERMPDRTTAAITRSREVSDLAAELWRTAVAEDFETCIDLACRQVNDLFDFAEQWDASASQARTLGLGEAEDVELDETELALERCGTCGETLPAIEMEQGCPACHATQLHAERAALETIVYVPSALEPQEQRAVDKAIFERARGIAPQHVGRFWFVPSRTTGGTVYRVTLDSCTCEAGQHGRYCWHRALIGIERELAA